MDIWSEEARGQGVKKENREKLCVDSYQANLSAKTSSLWDNFGITVVIMINDIVNDYNYSNNYWFTQKLVTFFKTRFFMVIC